MRVLYTPEAKADLKDIRRYIGELLQNPQAAKNVLATIKKSVAMLRESPFLGAPISSFLPSHINAEDLPVSLLDYRRLVCKRYSVFYRVGDDAVYVDRILHGSRDFINQLEYRLK
ncbi:MAG: type II toxin-antitoxin system RelE/ParE family toxin [Oscillospiraceae bacterium]|nr:type II toxin-antitoxin system RelE/ParE family toxin [Oscillospiraceae bacterium]